MPDIWYSEIFKGILKSLKGSGVLGGSGSPGLQVNRQDTLTAALVQLLLCGQTQQIPDG